MSKVVAIMSMSLDGYVADPNDGVAEGFDWYLSSGDVEFHTGGSDPMTFRVSGPSAEHLRGLWSELGAVVTGRRTFEVADGWGGNHAWGPAFILSHHVPAGWPRPDSTVHFVTDGASRSPWPLWPRSVDTMAASRIRKEHSWPRPLSATSVSTVPTRTASHASGPTR
jgi:hypothetical protein